MTPEVVPFRVRYPEVDRMSVAHHTHYFVWFELGRTELMRRAGSSYRAVEDECGLFFPVIEAAARYRRSAHYDEELEVRTVVAELSPLKVRFEYRIVRPEDETLLAEGFTVHAAVDRNGRPCRMPPEFEERLSPWLTR